MVPAGGRRQGDWEIAASLGYALEQPGLRTERPPQAHKTTVTRTEDGTPSFAVWDPGWETPRSLLRCWGSRHTAVTPQHVSPHDQLTASPAPPEKVFNLSFTTCQLQVN